MSSFLFAVEPSCFIHILLSRLGGMRISCGAKIIKIGRQYVDRFILRFPIVKGYIDLKTISKRCQLIPNVIARYSYEVIGPWVEELQPHHPHWVRLLHLPPGADRPQVRKLTDYFLEIGPD